MYGYGVFRVVFERITAYGHENISAKHPSTIEVTKEDYLTPHGDCIVGVGADKALSDLSREFRDLLRDRCTVLIALFYIDNRLYDIVLGHGDEGLILENNTKIIFRRSTYIDDATIAIRVNKAARDLDRGMISLLRNPETRLIIVLIALKPLEIYPEYVGVGRVIEYLPISSN